MNTGVVRKNEVKRNGFDMEKLVIVLTMAAMGAFGTVLLICGLLEVELLRFSFGTFIGLVIGLTGLYFGVMLLSQYRK